MNEIEVPEGMKLANGYIYKVYFEVGRSTVPDSEVAQALAALGVVKVQKITDGGVNVVVTPNTNTKENA